MPCAFNRFCQWCAGLFATLGKA
ncbi:hypothetical protein [Sulfitobacter pontiacus]